MSQQRQRASARSPWSWKLHWAHLSASAQGSSRPEAALIIANSGSHRSPNPKTSPRASQASLQTSLRPRGSCQGVPSVLADDGGDEMGWDRDKMARGDLNGVLSTKSSGGSGRWQAGRSKMRWGHVAASRSPPVRWLPSFRPFSVMIAAVTVSKHASSRTRHLAWYLEPPERVHVQVQHDYLLYLVSIQRQRDYQCVQYCKKPWPTTSSCQLLELVLELSLSTLSPCLETAAAPWPSSFGPSTGRHAASSSGTQAHRPPSQGISHGHPIHPDAPGLHDAQQISSIKTNKPGRYISVIPYYTLSPLRAGLAGGGNLVFNYALYASPRMSFRFSVGESGGGPAGSEKMLSRYSVPS
ncbi:hypothetical protein FALBO_9169 [Fusarium albosuccineum]|uniref:Uncharacterized protein n=1 Tax=Fusarium albosuccineum TaxID=1237068 RepID=A0A8H4L9V2_9HYPO|nr:hypothetical protein FALBO_9169 [Fusarium albosuccineum]